MLLFEVFLLVTNWLGKKTCHRHKSPPRVSCPSQFSTASPGIRVLLWILCCLYSMQVKAAFTAWCSSSQMTVARESILSYSAGAERGSHSLQVLSVYCIICSRYRSMRDKAAFFCWTEDSLFDLDPFQRVRRITFHGLRANASYVLTRLPDVIRVDSPARCYFSSGEITPVTSARILCVAFCLFTSVCLGRIRGLAAHSAVFCLFWNPKPQTVIHQHKMFAESTHPFCLTNKSSVLEKLHPGCGKITALSYRAVILFNSK